MIRKTIIVVLTLLIIVTSVAWATSYRDVGSVFPERSDVYTYSWDWHNHFYFTSLDGWLRVGAMRRTGIGLLPRRTVIDEVTIWIMVNPFLVKPSTLTSVLNSPDSHFLKGVVRTYNASIPRSHNITAIAVPHWLVCVVLLLFPAIAFIRGPLRRWRRHRKGVCLKCGYNLEGNVSGVCSECGIAI